MDEQTEENLDVFKPILDAAKACETSKFVLGDAILEICGPPGKPGVNNGSTEKIKAAATYLQEHGIDYNHKYLTDIRDLSHVFPAPKRLGAGISWSVYREFRPCPQLLTAWMKENPDLIMTVSEAKKKIEEHKAQLQRAEERKAAREAKKLKKPTAEESTSETATDTISEPVETQSDSVETAPDPTVIETDAEDTQFVPDGEPEPEEPKTDKKAVTALAAQIVEADNMFEVAVKLTNFVKSAHPDDSDWISEMIDSVSKTQEELKKLKSLLRGLSNKSKPVSNGGDNVTPFPMAAAPGE